MLCDYDNGSVDGVRINCKIYGIKICYPFRCKRFVITQTLPF